MDYDPVKDRLIRFFERSIGLQRGFFGLLHLVFLRSWYVRRAVGKLLALNPKAHVLDAGTGFGQYSDWLLRRFPHVRVTAVDIKQDYLSRLDGYFSRTRLAPRAEVRFGDLLDLQETGPFDLILSVDVMEHIEDDVGVFRAFHRVLKPGGYVVINTPSDLGGSGVQAEGDVSFIGEHVRDGYSIPEITEKLGSAGLRLHQAEYGYGTAGAMAWRILVQVPMRLLGTSMAFVPLVAVWYVVALPMGLLLNAADMATPNERGTGLTVVAVKG